MHLVFALDVPPFERRQFEAAFGEKPELKWVQLRELKLYHLIFDRSHYDNARDLIQPLVREDLGLTAQVGLDLLRRSLGLSAAEIPAIGRDAHVVTPVMANRWDFPANLIPIGLKEDRRLKLGAPGREYEIDAL
ncbi:hypothetical protein HYV43_01800 [Candidatus Micrarchaeota archaeon]|nr:hypothetical protein [Candidatus Micrarchaeota archaeon]